MAEGGKQHRGAAPHERLHNMVARDLGVAIVTGRHRPGETLPGEMAASEALRISRPAYREAVRMLAAKGLLESRPKAGTRVTPREQWNLLDPEVLGWLLENEPTPEILAELFELRLLIEPAAAALAARRRSEHQLRVLKAALANMGRNAPDSPEGQAADELFHETILAATGNALLVRLASIVATSIGYVAGYKREHAHARDTWPDHAALAGAIEAARPNDARKTMTRLLEHARDDLGIAEPDVPVQPERRAAAS